MKDDDLVVDQHKAPRAPLPDYFNDDPAPFTLPVILFAVYLGVTVLAVLVELKLCYSFMYGAKWNSMTESSLAGITYTPALDPLFYLLFVAKTTVLFAAGALFILLERKSWSFIKWVRVGLLAALGYQGLEILGLLIMRSSLPGRDVGRPFDVLLDMEFWIFYAMLTFVSVSITLIWFAYFSNSERVKRIFIN
jgi:hypothetical protein